MTQGATARLVAYYLPQFHPIPENDDWWGSGFTEWFNVAKARPLFPGHYQPHMPADLGFYDLRVPETRFAQAEMARRFGIEAFCYYDYWFAGKRLLERPFSEVVKSGQPDFPFCLCWANETWTGAWHGAPDRVLIEQTYPGPSDDEKHFYALLNAFGDDRYLKVDGKPVFLVYSPEKLPDARRTTDLWRALALRTGLRGLYLVAVEYFARDPSEQGFDAVTPKNLARVLARVAFYRRRKVMKALAVCRELLRLPLIYPYGKAITHLLVPEATRSEVHPCVFPNWDNTPRSGLQGLVLHGSTPEWFRRHLRQTIEQVRHKPAEQRIVFIKSWNEWAEGNHLEPDLRFGTAYLQVVKDEASRA